MDKPTLNELEDAARVIYGHFQPTPHICWPLLCQRARTEVWVKHENHTPIGAFKIRGGLVYMDGLRREQPNVKGVITATRGNHGQSVALAATHAGLEAVVVVPHGNNPEKNSAMRALGAELVEHGDDFQASAEFASDLAGERKLHFVNSFHPWLVKGVGTYSLEFLGAVQDLDTVYIPIGMGSGISGLISARDALGLKTKVVGVVSENAPAYKLSFEKGEVVATNSSDTLADGVACRSPNADALDIIINGADRVISVSDDAILAAMGHYLTDTHNLAEGAGAIGLAALLAEKDKMKGKKVGLILSGGNADRALIERTLNP